MKSKPFLKLNLNLLRRPDHKWLLGSGMTRKLGAYVLVLMYLSSCENGVASFESFHTLSMLTHMNHSSLRKLVEESGLFYVDKERGLFQSKYLCEVLSCQRRVGEVSSEAQRRVGAVPTPCSGANLINRAREDIDIDKDIEKEKKEDGGAASFTKLLDLKEREPEGVAELFGDEALLRQVAARVNYLICSPRNRPLVRRWLADYIRSRGYYRAHPLNRQTAALKLYELLKPGTESRRQFWEYMNRSLAEAWGI